jgi:putative RNA 2'-phosphotransferase
LTVELIREVVATSDKKRFALSADGERIRANRGHSVSVDSELVAVQPTEVLLRGTAARFVASSERESLLPGARNHVHLSSDEETAVGVGQRHGKPVVFLVNAREMFTWDVSFFRAENGV